MRLKTWHCYCLLALAVLVVFYPSLQAGFNSADDLKMLGGTGNSGPIDLLRHFFPSNKNVYYRPLTTLSFLVDRDVWGGLPPFMHLENILLHLGCSFLVFAITRRLLRVYTTAVNSLAFLSAFFFAIHPLTAESVCWISGRTDPLASFFLLLAVWLVFTALQENRSLMVFPAMASLLCACLAKEVAVFILPGLLWLIAIYPKSDTSLINRLRCRWFYLGSVVATVSGYFVLRNIAIVKDTGIKTAVRGISAGHFDLFDKVRIGFKVYGFYFKKLFIPWPLNFAITNVSDWYVLVGIVLAILLLYLAWRSDLPGAFGLMAFCVLSPSLLVVFGKMTWTPLAERYLYTSIALFTPLAAYLILRLQSSATVSVRRLWRIALVGLLVAFSGTTLHRSWIWQDNLRLYRDTVAKSPEFAGAKTELASALFRRGRTEEAKVLLAGLHKDENASAFINDEMNLASVLLAQGDPDGAYQVLLPLLDGNPKKYYDLLQILIRVNDKRLGKTTDQTLIDEIQSESLGWLLERQRIHPRAFTLYRIGKQYLAMGNEVRALEFFKRAYAQSTPGAHYRDAAATFIKRLEER